MALEQVASKNLIVRNWFEQNLIAKQSRRHHENWVDHLYTHFNFTTHYSIIGSVHNIHDVERALLHPWKGLALSGGENDPRSLKVETYVSRWWRRRKDKKIFAQVKGRRVFESVPCVHTFMIIYVYTYCFPMLTTCITYENEKSQINSCRMYIKGDAWRTIYLVYLQLNPHFGGKIN